MGTICSVRVPAVGEFCSQSVEEYSAVGNGYQTDTGHQTGNQTDAEKLQHHQTDTTKAETSTTEQTTEKEYNKCTSAPNDTTKSTTGDGEVKTDKTPISGETSKSRSNYVLSDSIKSLPGYFRPLVTGHCDNFLKGNRPARCVKLIVYLSKPDAQLCRNLSKFSSKMAEFCCDLDLSFDVLTLDVDDLGGCFRLEDLKNYITGREKLGIILLHLVHTDMELRVIDIPARIDVKTLETILGRIKSEDDKTLVSNWFQRDGSFAYLQRMRDGGASKSRTEQFHERVKVIRCVESTQLPELTAALRTNVNAMALILDLLLQTANQNAHSDNVTVLSSSPEALTEESDEAKGETTQSHINQKDSLMKQFRERLPKEAVLLVDRGLNKSQAFKKISDSLFKRISKTIVQINFSSNPEGNRKNSSFDELGLYNEIWTSLQLCHSYAKSFVPIGQDVVLEQLLGYINSTVNQVTILTGGTGSGKTTLVSKLVVTSMTSHPQWSIINRIFSTDYSMESLLISICDQIALIYGLKPTFNLPSETGSSAILSDVLNLIPSESPMLIIVDGLDQNPNFSPNMTWIPSRLPQGIKIILTVRDSGQMYKWLQGYLPKECFISMPDIDIQTLGKQLSVRVSDKGELFPELFTEALPGQVASPLFLTMLQSLIDMNSDVEFTKHVPTLSVFLELFFDSLDRTFTCEVVDLFLGYLCASRYGLTESELFSLVAHKADNLKDNKSTIPFSNEDYLALITTIDPILNFRIDNGEVLVTINPGVVKETTQKRYYEPNKQHLHVSIAAYFQNTLQHLKLDKHKDKTGKMHQNTCSVERRAVLELPYHMSRTTDPVNYAKEFLFKNSWLSRKLKTCGVRAILDDLSLCIYDTELKNMGVSVLQSFLFSLRFVLSVDPGQISAQSQIAIEAQTMASFPLIDKIMKDVRKKFPLRVETNFALCKDSNGRNRIDCLARIPSDSNDVITLSSTSGELSMINLTTMQSEVKISNLDNPKNIKMFDDKRAAILCGRVIEIYNIETGKLESKLKGVLNTKMPYFGIHDNKHVVALSRNRMYVNIMSTETGDMVSTFKVGESRFLDSLLVSANGEIVVCGDETQKPFPLLVWNLPQRKLVHDLRIAGHEFHTSISDISHDGHFATCVAVELGVHSLNFVVLYDLVSGQVFKKWNPDYNTTCLAISSVRNSVIAGLENGDILEWDMNDGTLKQELSGRGGEPKWLSLSKPGSRLVSVNRLSNMFTMCLYDLQQGIVLGSFTPDSEVTCCQISTNGDKVLYGVAEQSGVFAMWSSTDKESVTA